MRTELRHREVWQRFLSELLLYAFDCDVKLQDGVEEIFKSSSFVELSFESWLTRAFFLGYQRQVGNRGRYVD